MTRDQMLRFVLGTGDVVSLDEAEDVVQDVLTRLWAKHGHLDHPDAYLFASLRGTTKALVVSAARETAKARTLAVTPPDHVGIEVCKNGHLRTPESTRINPREGYKECVICIQVQKRKAYLRFKRRFPSGARQAA